MEFDAGYDFFSKSTQVGQHKLIRSYFKDGRVRSELYDLSEDPEEKLNLYDARKAERAGGEPSGLHSGGRLVQARSRIRE